MPVQSPCRAYIETGSASKGIGRAGKPNICIHAGSKNSLYWCFMVRV
jgi:hypothetical protein